MNRYNQGFGGFGPMEQCKNGKWVKSVDSQEAIRKLKDEIGRLEVNRDEWFERCMSEMEEADDVLGKHIATEVKLSDMTCLFYGSAVLNGILIGLLLKAHGVL